MIENLHNSKLQKFLTESQFKAKQEQEQQKKTVYQNIIKLDLQLEQVKQSLDSDIEPEQLKSNLIEYKNKLNNAQNSYLIAKDELYQMEQSLMIDINKSMIVLEGIKAGCIQKVEDIQQPQKKEQVKEQKQYNFTSVDAINDELQRLEKQVNILDQKSMKTYLGMYKQNTELNQRAFINMIVKLLPQYNINQLNNEYNFAKQYIDLEQTRNEFINKIKIQKQIELQQIKKQQEEQHLRDVKKEQEKIKQKMEKVKLRQQLKEQQKRVLVQQQLEYERLQKEKQQAQNKQKLMQLQNKLQKSQKEKELKQQKQQQQIQQQKQQQLEKLRIEAQNNRRQLQLCLERNQRLLEKIEQSKNYIDENKSPLKRKDEQINRLSSGLAPNVQQHSKDLYGLSKSEKQKLNYIKQQKEQGKKLGTVTQGIDIFQINSQDFIKPNWM